MPQASALSRLGVAKNTMVSFTTASVSIAGTALAVANVGIYTAGAVSVAITVYDGANTETVTATNLGALTGTAGTFTVSAFTKAHAAGVMVSAVTSATGAPTDFIPFTGITPYDEITWLDDTGVRGSRVTTYDQVEGPRMGMFEFAGDVFADTIGWPLIGILNDQGYTGGTPNTFTGSVKNSGNGQPTGVQYVDNNSAVARAYAGVVHSELALTFNADGKMTYSAKGTGYVSGPIAAPAASYSTLAVVPSWGITTLIGGVANVLVQEGSLTIKPASVDPINTLDGSQDPYAFFADSVEATGKMLFVYEDDAQLVNYLTNAKPSLDFTFARGAGATLEQIQFHMSSCGWRTGKPQRSKSYVELEVEFTALGNTSDAGASGGRSPLKTTLKNSLTNTGRYQ